MSLACASNGGEPKWLWESVSLTTAPVAWCLKLIKSGKCKRRPKFERQELTERYGSDRCRKFPLATVRPRTLLRAATAMGACGVGIVPPSRIPKLDTPSPLEAFSGELRPLFLSTPRHNPSAWHHWGR